MRDSTPAAAARTSPRAAPSSHCCGTLRCWQAARIGPETIAQELGGLIPAKRHAAELAADALHRALGSAVRHEAALAPTDRRTLVAMSGGVDSAVAALLCREAGEEAVAVTLELWSDPENDGDLSCCSAQAVRGARALAHELGVPHFSIDLRAEFRAGVVDPWLAAHAAGLHAEPVRALQRLGASGRDARPGRRGWVRGTLATGHYARIHREPARARAAAADGAPTRPRTRAMRSPRSRPPRLRGCGFRSAS